MRGGDAVKYRYFIDPVIAWNIHKRFYKNHKHLSGNLLCAQHYKKLSLGQPRFRIKKIFLLKQMKVVELMF